MFSITTLGDAILSLTKLPQPAKDSKTCKLEMLETAPKSSIFKIKHCKGWWPFQNNPEDDDDPDPVLAVSTALYITIAKLP